MSRLARPWRASSCVRRAKAPETASSPYSALALAFRRTAELTIRRGGKPYSNMALMPTERMGPPPGASPPMPLRATWVATSLAPGSKKMSKHTLAGGNGRDLLDLLARLKTRAEQRIAAPVRIVAIQEVGLDGFWIHRLLEANGVESHVVDPASIAVPRRHRRAKTDAIDGETLLRTLMAWQRGEPRVCAMTVPPSPSEEDCRRVSRERATLLRERIQHTNRIRGLLFGQGITNYNPLHKNRRECLEELRTGDGHPVPVHVKA